MPRKKTYNEGDWFAVPLDDGGYALGIAVRTAKSGNVLGYFFGPRTQDLPTSASVVGLCPSDSVWIRHFGDLGLSSGEWPIIARTSPWIRADWPNPMFGHIDVIDPTIAFGRRYDDDRLDEIVSEVRIPVSEAKLLPEDGLSGHIALIVRLTKILREVPKDGWDFG